MKIQKIPKEKKSGVGGITFFLTATGSAKKYLENQSLVDGQAILNGFKPRMMQWSSTQPRSLVIEGRSVREFLQTLDPRTGCTSLPFQKNIPRLFHKPSSGEARDPSRDWTLIGEEGKQRLGGTNEGEPRNGPR